jgi:outer membrane protein OmpA-like peptidoglycan-associated protein/tetratricopeptide (TPR) repeat protein
MKNRILYFIILGAFLTGCTNALYKKGVKNYEKMAYSKAIENFEKYLSKRDNNDAVVKLADSYRKNNDYVNAEKWYARAVNDKNTESIHLFHYARILMNLEKYEEAKKWLVFYLQREPDDFVAEMLLASCMSLKSFMKDTTLYSVKEVELPDVNAAFGQIPFSNGIIFTADKAVLKNSKKFEWTGRSYLDMYFSRKDENGKWISPVMLKGNINGEYHEGPVCFTKDGKTVYFTRSNYSTDGHLVTSSKKENNLKLYKAELLGENWSNVQELPFNNNEFSCGHPTLSPDEKTLYFVSDRSGGWGGTDIYRASFDGSSWSAPENLGGAVNTAGNEMFPYMHADGTLYFSSGAHNNLGGLDVFMTSYDGKKWLQAENLNYPLNSSKDDFSFVMNEDNKTGYLASNRDDRDKIYEVTKHDPTLMLSGTVRHKNKMIPIDSAVIEIHNKTDRITEIVMTGAKGRYSAKLKPGCEYIVKASKRMFFPVTESKSISTVGKKVSENFTADFQLDQMVIEKPIVLENIYYDLDKWFIRSDAAAELDKLVNVLFQNPNIFIELSSHTDSRAGDQYNLVLSDKRAKAAVDYLVSKGIEKERLKWKGYGETKLVNQCKNNVPCSEEEHQKNRRTEFKVVKIVSNVSFNYDRGE